MSEYIKDITSKLDRAKFHLDSLNNMIKEFFELQPYQVVKNEEGSTGDLVYTVVVYHEVPETIAPIVGDIVHNLRSVLDYIIWQSVQYNNETPNRNNFFPICSSKHNFIEIAPRALAGTNTRTQSLVSRLHPYKEENELLWKLHNLDIVDKHRLLLGVGSAHTHLIIQMKMDVPWLEEPIISPKLALTPSDIQFPLKSGDEIFRVMAQARKGNSPIEEPEYRFNVAFGDGESVIGEPILQTMHEITNHIDRVVNLFEKFVFK